MDYFERLQIAASVGHLMCLESNFNTSRLSVRDRCTQQQQQQMTRFRCGPNPSSKKGQSRASSRVGLQLSSCVLLTMRSVGIPHSEETKGNFRRDQATVTFEFMTDDQRRRRRVKRVTPHVICLPTVSTAPSSAHVFRT